MKNRNNITIKGFAGLLLIAISLLSFPACTKDFEDINKNPHEFNKIEPENMLASAVKRSMNLMASMNARMFWPYGHQITISSGDMPGYGSSLSELNSVWKDFYSMIYLVRDLQIKYKGVEGYENRVLIAQAWECYMYYILTTTFGGVPYRDACRDDITSLPYDTETFIYKDILARLTESFDNIDLNKDKLGADVIFVDGDLKKWKTFINSLRLKVALEVQNAVPEEAQRYGRMAMANEEYLVSSNQNNICAKWGGSNSTEYSWYYARYVLDNTVSEGSRPYLSHMMFVYMRSYGDDRMSKYADKTRVPFQIQDTIWADDFSMRAVVKYTVPYNGKPKTTQLAGLDENEFSDASNNPLKSLAETQFSLVSGDFLKVNGGINLIWYADVCFMESEAALLGWGGTKTAEQYYNEGIDASFNQYGLTAAQALTYRSQAGVRWGTARVDAYPDFRMLVNSNVTTDPLQHIIVQRWLAGYFHGSHDAWCYLRRTRKIDLPPHLNPGKLVLGGQSKIANLPERMHYPIDEKLYNLQAYNVAVGELGAGGDILPTYLKMALPYNRKSSDEWMQTPIHLNSKCYLKWFGITLGDLEAAGLVMGQDIIFVKVLEEE